MCSSVKRYGLLAVLIVEPAIAQEASPQDILSQNAASEDTQPTEIKGYLFQRGDRAPMVGIQVTIPDADLESWTDANGLFSFGSLSPGEYRLQIMLSDDLQLEKHLNAPLEHPIYYYLDPPPEENSIVVIGSRPAQEATKHILNNQELNSLPGSNGDVIRAVQNFPGVARATLSSGQMIVRGSSAEDSGVFLSGHAIPLFEHFGAVRSVVPGELIESATFFPGNFAANRGPLMGGILDLELRAPRKDRIHGRVEADLFDVGLFVEGPITEKSSFAAGMRRSYIDLVLKKMMNKFNELEFTIAPRYYDYQFLFDWQNASHHINITFLGSNDELQLLLNEPLSSDPSVQGNTQYMMGFNQLITQWETTINEQLEQQLSLSVNHQQTQYHIADSLSLDLTETDFQINETVHWDLQTQFKLHAGLSAKFQLGQLQAKSPLLSQNLIATSTPISAQNLLTSERNFFYIDPIFFVTPELTFFEKKFNLFPGLRIERPSSIHEPLIDPRLTLLYHITPSMHLKAAIGRYSQPPSLLAIDRKLGNSSLKAQHSLHHALGIEKQFEKISLDFTLFYKSFSQLVTSGSELDARYQNRGSGNSYGLESLIRYQSNHVLGWLSYSLTKALRKDSDDSQEYPFEHDQTHLITVIAQYLPNRKWKLGLRWRYATGDPYTAYIGSIHDNGSDTWLPYTGQPNAARMSAYHQLDLRIDRCWIFDLWVLTAYLDLQNAYNHHNVEAITYNYDYTEQAEWTGLPIIPSFGIKGEF